MAAYGCGAFSTDELPSDSQIRELEKTGNEKELQHKEEVQCARYAAEQFALENNEAIQRMQIEADAAEERSGPALSTLWSVFLVSTYMLTRRSSLRLVRSIVAFGFG